MSKFLSSLGIAQSELKQLDALASSAATSSATDVVQSLVDTGEFEQGLWRMPSGESVNFEMVNWEAKRRPQQQLLWQLPPDVHYSLPQDEDDEAEKLMLDLLPIDCLSRVALGLSLADLAAASAASPAFRRLLRSDACWVERLRRHFGPGYLRGCHARVAADRCCANPFARIFCQALFGLYRARPEGVEFAFASATSTELLQQRLVPDSCLGGALFQRPLLSPVFLGRPLVMEFRFPGVHPGRYEALLRVKKLLCDPLDSESVASAVDSSGVRVPLLQARINRRNVTISNFECSILVTAIASSDEQGAAATTTTVLSADTVSHLLQNYSMPPDRWFYWRLATLELRPEDLAEPETAALGVTVWDLRARVSVMRRGVADATVTQEEFERELRNALLVDHLFLRLEQQQQNLQPPAESLAG